MLFYQSLYPNSHTLCYLTYFVSLDYSFFTLYKVDMGPHPVPQNISSFQFHLVGDMTLKQFIYLATGVGIAYLLFVFFVSSYPVIVWPFIVISAGTGAAFAFLPIGSRPLDHWTGAFFKAIYSPTQRYWVKGNVKYNEEPLFNSRYLMYVSGAQPVKTREVLRNAMPGQQTNQIKAAPSFKEPVEELSLATLPSSEELKKTVDLARQAQALQVQIIQTERTLNQIKAATSKSSPIPIDYSMEVTKILSDLQKLVTQANEIRSQLDAINPAKDTREPEMKQLREKIRIVTSEKPKQTQIALTTFPNVISGIVKDQKDNYLEGVVAVIYDKEGLPVRALKTNKLGQFSGSTPLSNGTYTLELEKDNYSFDVLQIQLDGGVMPPLLITARE